VRLSTHEYLYKLLTLWTIYLFPIWDWGCYTVFHVSIQIDFDNEGMKYRVFIKLKFGDFYWYLFLLNLNPQTETNVKTTTKKALIISNTDRCCKWRSIIHPENTVATPQQKRLQPETCKQTFRQSKKAKRIHDGMADALREMAVGWCASGYAGHGWQSIVGCLWLLRWWEERKPGCF
jgi:hypothetical protein